jgi:SP family myo-inositol transporter-like MFS transporter 13
MSENFTDGSIKARYQNFLLLVAGLGGLLYGIDVGIISGAMPYLEATFKDAAGQTLTSSQLSFIVAAVLLGTVFSTLFAGMLADFFGRKKMMIVSGLLFVISIPVIALAHNYDSLMAGRLLQGISGGLIGVVIPLYLAECLGAKNRGKGTGIFQWLLTLGIVAAALIGFFFSHRVDEVAQLGDAQKLFAFKDHAWRGIFWVSLPPGILFVLGAFFVSESPRWLFRRGKKDLAVRALLRSRSESQAQIELSEMEATVAAEKEKSGGEKTKESLLRRKYVIPFLLACVILSCNQATGVNSVIGYNATILLQAGLDDKSAHFGYLLFTVVNFLTTIFAVMLVDRKGRKFLLSIGTAGVIVSMTCVGLLFHHTEKMRVDVKDALQIQIDELTHRGIFWKRDFHTAYTNEISLNNIVSLTNQTFVIHFDEETALSLPEKYHLPNTPKTLVLIYSYGDFHFATTAIRSDNTNAVPIKISRADVLPANKIIAFFKNPFADLPTAKNAPLKIDNAFITPVPSRSNGIFTAALLYIYMAFFAIGPGVCVWLALSELMPTRIRSNGMSIALLINQVVATVIAAVFLPTVGAHGYSTMFFLFAGCTVIYFITAAFFLPETKGKTLEEIEQYFEGKKPL